MCSGWSRRRDQQGRPSSRQGLLGGGRTRSRAGRIGDGDSSTGQASPSKRGA
jgi:hypothetical protein